MKPERMRDVWGYEPNTPQCCNCVGYRKAHIAHDGRGVVVAVRARCEKGRFEVAPGGCCNKWSSRTGERLTT